MECPACGNVMTELAIGEILIDACRNGCGGLWFDNWELNKVDEPTESAGESLLDLPRNPEVKVDREKRLECPRHPGIVMMRHFWSVKRQVTVDECPECRGIFLDPGELAGIRSEYGTEAERRAATQAYFGEMFDARLNEELEPDQARADATQRLARVFSFISPGKRPNPGK